MAISENKRIHREIGLLFISSVGLYLNRIFLFFFSPLFSVWVWAVRIGESPGRVELGGQGVESVV